MGSEPETPETDGDDIRASHDKVPEPDPPPIFSTWRKAYFFVIGFLLFLILLFYLFTVRYA